MELRGGPDSLEKMFSTVLFMIARQLETTQTSNGGGTSYFYNSVFRTWNILNRFLNFLLKWEMLIL